MASGPNGPFDAEGGVEASHLGTIKCANPNGYQVTYFGYPLCKFIADSKPGQTNGENVAAFNGIWHLLTVQGRPNAGDAHVSLELTANGMVLDPPTAFDTHRSLYLLTAYSSSSSACNGVCAGIWPPLITGTPPAAAAGSGVDSSHLGAILRSDGTFQVTYYGHPLYLFGPAFTGTSGEGKGSSFHVVTLSGALH
jgi:predicted lipoprotein with Yx(FWY)xxD motif